MYLKTLTLIIILFFAITNSYTVEKIIDEKTLNLTPDEQIYFKGLINTKNKNYDVAIQLFQKVIEQNPKHLKAHYMKGLILLYQNNLVDAEVEFKKTIELDDKFFLAYAGLGKIYLEKRLFNDALIQFDKALKINPKYKDMFFDIGLTYLGLANYDKAYDYFNSARYIDLDRNKSKTSIEAIDNYCIDEKIRDFFQGLLFYKLYYYQSAQRKFESLLKTEKEELEKWQKLGRIYLSLSQIGNSYEY